MNIQQGQPEGSMLAGLSHPVRVAPAVFTPDTPAGPDRLGRGKAAAFLAEVVAHRAAGTPFCIGIFGPAGSGKSGFLAGILSAVERLASGASEAGLATPFLGNIVVARIEAQSGLAPATSILRQVAAALRGPYPGLAADARHAGLDPHAVARDATDRLNAARQALETERSRLDALTGRQAKLVDHVLFESAGSRIDAFARGHRGRIERSWRGFGIVGEPLHAYKAAVREASEARGPAARWTGGLRAFWAYRGQGRLLVLAAACLLAAWGLGALTANEDKLVEMVRTSSDKLAGAADWLQARWTWLGPAQTALEAVAALALAINVVRGLRFLLPVHRGAALLSGDVEGRRRDLDSQLAHQTSRVDALAREVDRAAQVAGAAESRLATVRTDPADDLGPGGEATSDAHAARSFLAALSTAMAANGATDTRPSGTPTAPSRIVVGIDGLDRLSSGEAASFLRTARTLLDGPGFITVVTADRAHLASGLADTDLALATAGLNRLIQLPYRLAAEGETWSAAGPFARALLEPEGTDDGELPELDAAVSSLDRPWTAGEIAAVEAAAAIAGSTPRSVKRFVNLYRIARADPRLRTGDAKDFGTLAVTLAAQSTGLPLGYPGAEGFGETDDPLRRARVAVGSALGTVLSAREGERGAEAARTYDLGA